MRLLQLQGNGGFSLTEHLGAIPPYAILSHTWGADNEEVTFEDLTKGTGYTKAGYEKLSFCGKQALEDGLQFFWIDTCCIDKSSSSELSESINSMFRWYQNSEKCYVFMSDVSKSTAAHDMNGTLQKWEHEFRESRWFRRGWTLQELLAPASVEFFSKDGDFLGTKRHLEATIHNLTGIAIDALRGAPLSQFSEEDKLYWATARQTKREEDAAYCLLGIFDISMPLLYGEGRNNAEKRLLREIKEGSRNIQMTPEEQKSMLLESLRFEQIYARQMTVKTAHVRTCRWLLNTSEYLTWLDPDMVNQHHGFLWIKGKPGTGKSTLMKFAFLDTRQTIGEEAVISFFFNARGEEIEKSTIGMYRSLLLQLLERNPALQHVFESLSLSTSRLSSNYKWTIDSLKMLLEQAIKRLGNLAIICFIDALDECDEDQIRDMIRFFEDVGEHTVSAHINFRVCFSSRHYPHVTIKKSLELVLDQHGGHMQDMANYLESELRVGQGRVAKQIRNDLQLKASGIFMWVVLVVSILNREYDRGNIQGLQQRLADFPQDLDELFRDIMARNSENRERLLLCIQWVLYAEQPLSPEQLYFAVLAGNDSESVSNWDPDEVTTEVIKRFILDSSKGLIETTKTQRPIVQFIHESVRDFFLKENGLCNIWPGLRINLSGQSHERLKSCCMAHLYKAAMPTHEKPSRTLVSSVEVKSAAYPILEYAAENVLLHSDAAKAAGITQAMFLQQFSMREWIYANDLLEQRDPRKLIGLRAQIYHKHVTPAVDAFGSIAASQILMQAFQLDQNKIVHAYRDHSDPSSIVWAQKISIADLATHFSQHFLTTAMRKYWLPEVLKTPHAFFGALLMAATHQDGMYERPESIGATAIRGYLLHRLRYDLTKQSMSMNDSTIVTATELLAESIIRAHESDMKGHEQGLIVMITRCGGLTQLGHASRLPSMVSCMLFMSALLGRTSPHLLCINYCASRSTRTYAREESVPESPMYWPGRKFVTITRSDQIDRRSSEILEDVRMMTEVFLGNWRQADKQTTLNRLHAKVMNEYPSMSHLQQGGEMTKLVWRYEAIRIASRIHATRLRERILLFKAVDSRLTSERNEAAIDVRVLIASKHALQHSDLSQCWDDMAGVLLWIGLTQRAACHGILSGDSPLKRYFVALSVRVSMGLNFEHPEALNATLLQAAKINDLFRL